MYPRVQNSKGARKPLWQEPLARADSGSYHTLTEDIKYIAELYFSIHKAHNRTTKSRKISGLSDLLLCVHALCASRVLAVAFLARSLTHSGSHYASPIVHSLARSLRPSLTGSLTLP